MRPTEALDRAFEGLVALPAHKKAGMAATFVTAGLCARARLPFVPAVICATIAGYAAEKAYVVIDDVHQAALAQQAWVGLQARKAMTGDAASAD